MAQPTCFKRGCPNPRAIGVYCIEHAGLPAWLVRARRERERIDDWLAETGGLFCVYCGEQAQGRDHLVALPMSGPEWRPFVPTVPACISCNSTLSDAFTPDIRGRSELLARRLRRKHAALLKVTRYQEPEESFGATLRTMVEARRATRLVLQSRLAFLDLGGACEAHPSALLD